MQYRFAPVGTRTQKVDGVHRCTGSLQINDISGGLHVLAFTHYAFRERVEDIARLDVPPLWPCCTSVVRPEAVVLGEELPVEKLTLLRREIRRGLDLIFLARTSSVVAEAG